MHIQDSILIKAPVDRVFAVGRDPRRWGDWWVNQSKPRRIRYDGSAGTLLSCRHMVAGKDLPLKIKVVVDRFESDGSGHWRGDLLGSIRGQQRWDYTPCSDGTEVTADVELEVPRRVVTNTSLPLHAERMERNALRQTLQNLKFMFEH